MPESFDLDESIAVLERTPRTLLQLLDRLPDGWTTVAEGADTWSARDALAHVTDLEDTDWMVRVHAILNDGTTKPFAPVDRVGFRHALAGKSVRELLDLFAERRARNLEELRALQLTPGHYALRGLHPDPTFGQVTLAQLVATWVVHDLTHLAQIVRVMAKRYDAAVGPWKAYLGVLNR